MTQRPILICYLVAIALHVGVLSIVLAPTPIKVEKTVVDVSLEATAPTPPPSTVTSKPVKAPTETKTIAKPAVQESPPKPIQAKHSERIALSEPTYARHAAPIYPYDARRRHEEGIVTVELFIDTQGNLEKAVVTHSSGYPLLDAAAMEAMKQSLFEPAQVGGVGVPSKAMATVTFKLE